MFQDIGLGTCAGAACVPTMEASLRKLNANGTVTAVQGCTDMKCGTGSRESGRIDRIV